jgi:hypothetical protein
VEKENEIVEKLKDFLKENLVGTAVPRERRIFVYIRKDALKDTEIFGERFKVQTFVHNNRCGFRWRNRSDISSGL